MTPLVDPAEIAENLDRHILSCWFPRAVDPKGGFHQNYGAQWEPLPDHDRGVVYQARLTWTAAEAARRGYGEAFAAWAQHGINYLWTHLWDTEHGGFFWTTTNDQKHVYGNAFALYALARAGALEQAKQVFLWLEAHAHDAEHGGWIEALTRAGEPIPAQDGNDVIGTRLGLKSMNTHIHVLEALTALYPLWPDPFVEARLQEAYSLVKDTIVDPRGFQHLFFTRDWQVVPAPFSFGHDVETAFLLSEAATVLGVEGDAVKTLGRTILDHALDNGWDTRNGGFFDATTHREKIWWVVAEGLNTLLLMHAHFGTETNRYATAFQAQWAFIKTHQVDEKHGGWYSSVHEDGAPIVGQRKSDPWKEPYHQARALWHVGDLLVGSH